MRRLPKFLIAAAALSQFSGCSESSFSGSSGATDKAPSALESGSPEPGSGSPTESSPPAPAMTPAGGAQGCVKGDFVNIAFTGPAKACFDSGRTWNFNSIPQKCQDIRKAKFDCTWDNVLKWFANANPPVIPSPAILTGQAAGRKIVSCGESEDGSRLAVIWINPPQGGAIQCDNPAAFAGLFIVGCYPTEGTTDANVMRQRVFACMDSL